MNYNSQLQSNNVDLQQVLQTLQNKAAGTPNQTTSVTVDNQTDNPVFYFDANGEVQQVAAKSIGIVKTLNGFLSYKQVNSTQCTGNYVTGLETTFGSRVVIFLSDGGTMRCIASSSMGGIE